MRYIGEQRTRQTGARAPFTPVGTRLDLGRRDRRARDMRAIRSGLRVGVAMIVAYAAICIILKAI